jgi:hypothetical protein
MVKYINYKGKLLPLLITFWALMRTEEENGKGVDSDSGYKEFETLFYYALKEGHAYEEIEMPYSKEKAAMILGSCFNQFKEMMPEFMSAISGKEEAEETKKN